MNAKTVAHLNKIAEQLKKIRDMTTRARLTRPDDTGFLIDERDALLKILSAWVNEDGVPAHSSNNSAMVSSGWVVVAIERFANDHFDEIAEQLDFSAVCGLIYLVDNEIFRHSRR